MSDEERDRPEPDDQDHNQHVTDLLGGYALGALDPDETELVASHVERCLACRAELAGYEEVTNWLAYASPVQQVPVRARAELLARIDAIGTANTEQMIVLSPPPRAHRKHSWLPALPALPRVAAFAAAPLLVALVVVGVMAGIVNDKQQELEAIQQQQARVSDFVRDFAAAPSSANSDSPLVPSSPAHDATGRVLINWETNEILLLVVDLPQAEDGGQYVAWLDIRDTDEYTRESTLVIDELGRANAIIAPAGPVSSYTEVVVTIETDPNSSFPVGPRVLSAGIPPKP